MLTLQKLNRLWQQKRFGQLLRDVTASRPEAGMALDLRLSTPSAAAAAGLLRLGELHQLQTPLARELVRHLLFAQCADGRWTAGACQVSTSVAKTRGDLQSDLSGGVSARRANRKTATTTPIRAGKAEGIRRAIARVGPAAADAMLTALVLRSLCSLPREPAAGRLTQVTLPETSLSTGDACERGFAWLAKKQLPHGCAAEIGQDAGQNIRRGWGGEDEFGRCIATGFVLLQLGRQAEFRAVVDVAGAAEVGQAAVFGLGGEVPVNKITQHERGAKQLVWDHASMRVGTSLMGAVSNATSAAGTGTTRVRRPGMDGGRRGLGRSPAGASGKARRRVSAAEPTMPLLLRV